MSDPEKEREMHYLDLWMQQSQLLWSRLKVVSALHTAVLVVWYTLYDKKEFGYANAALGVGFITSFFVGAIMHKDGLYLNALREKAGDSFPSVIGPQPNGRACGIWIVAIFAIVEAILLLRAAMPQ